MEYVPVSVAALVTVALGVIVGIIGYFLKRQIARTDKAEADICQMKDGFARRDELDKLEKSIVNQLGNMEQRFNARLEKTDAEIKTIRENYITTDTFVREIGKLTSQNDRIYGILLDLTRERK